MKSLILLFLICVGCSHPLVLNPVRLKESKRLNLQGLLALRSKNLKEAQANFQLAYQLAPNPESLDGLGICALSQQNYPEAQRLFIKSYQTSQNYYNSLINLAFLYEKAGQLDLADRLYRSLIDKYPENFKLQNNFSAFQFDYYRPSEVSDLEFRLLQAKSLNPDPLIIRNLTMIKGYRERN